ncbi:MAG TPA: sigma-54 dependent transcriptional regulator [Candidatus Binatia bacterium]|nr:sigma-54 dependent transcriptional regulator [Candidatus Binatia bacterium]
MKHCYGLLSSFWDRVGDRNLGGKTLNGAILIAEDHEIARKSIQQYLQQEGYRVEEAADGDAAIEAINNADFDLVITDLKMPGASGLDVLKHVREVSPNSLVIVTTAFGSVESAIEALRLGAQDYVIKPVIFEDLLSKVRHVMEYRRLAWEIQMLRRELSSLSPTFTDLVGRSQAMRNIITLIQKVASSDSTVLITGESGCGKEVVARAIHSQSARKDKLFLPVNCSAIPDTLLESQLFGHVKGSFTGALNSNEGLFQRAKGGTIFLDEIADLSAVLQPKLLRAIEAKEILPVGSTQPAKVDVRIIAATNAELSKACEQGRFREDLYYRLNVINIRVPPLRERREDIAPLIDYLIRRHNTEMKKSYKGADNAAIRILMSLPWRGNIRELDNVLERAMILGNGEWITANDIPHAEKWEDSSHSAYAGPHDLTDALRAYEKMHIENVLKETDGNRAVAAKMLGLSRSSLYRKLESLGIYRHEERAAS